MPVVDTSGVPKIGLTPGYLDITTTTWTRADLAGDYMSIGDGNFGFLATFATSATAAEAAFQAGNYFIITAHDDVDCYPDQYTNDYNLYLRVFSGDVIAAETIDNDSAVDKGTDPETVGIPITGTGFQAGDYVTIAGSTYYDGTYRIFAQTVNEIVIFHAYTDETFTGAETVTHTLRLQVTKFQV